MSATPSGPPNEPPRFEVPHGLPMFTGSDPATLAKEKAELADLAKGGVLKRWRWYFSKSGPGWMQSAQTLGAGS
ncbi:MAG TPA: hypothetical protein VM431_00755, partial [Phycisphaerae bacterium]|nr:hypothetical protein [Phycisphaerae bacterium]